MDTLSLIATLINNPDVEVFMPHRDPSFKNQKVTSFVTAMDRFNFSVKGLKNVLNESTGDYEKAFRTHSLIKDGVLVIANLDVRLRDEFQYIRYTNLGVLYESDGRTQVEETHKFDDDYIYKVVLNTTPLVTEGWIEEMREVFHRYVATETTLYEYRAALKRVELEWRKNLVPEPDTIGSTAAFNKIIPMPYVARTPEGHRTVSCVEYRIKSKTLQDSILFKCEKTGIENRHDSHNQLTDSISRTDKSLDLCRFMLRATALAFETYGDPIFTWSEKKPLPRSKSKFLETSPLDGDAILEKITYDIEVPYYDEGEGTDG